MERTLILSDKRGFAQCHASTLVRLPDERTMVSFFAGTMEMHPDTHIGATACRSGIWSKPTIMAKTEMTAHWNPVLFYDNSGRLHLFFKVGTKPRSWETYVMTLNKPGDCWSRPRKLINFSGKGGRGPVRNKIIIGSDGAWLAPASTEKFVQFSMKIRAGRIFKSADAIWDAFVDISTDEGKSWKRTPDIPYDRKKYGDLGGVIQPTLWESSPGRVHMFLRSTIGKVMRSDSDDGGRTWSEAVETEFGNPNSSVDVAKMSDGLLALVFNPASGDWVERTPISVCFSEGDGSKWTKPVVIEDGVGSFSYPAIVPTKKGFAMTYTWNRDNIAFCEMSVERDGYESDGTVRVNVSTSDHPAYKKEHHA